MPLGSRTLVGRPAAVAAIAILLASPGCGLSLTAAAVAAFSFLGGKDGSSNDPPSVALTVAANQNDVVRIDLRLIDPESDLADIRVEFSRSGGPWMDATEAVSLGSSGLFGLATSPAGETHTFLWNTLATPERTAGGMTFGANPDVRIRVTPIDGRSGKAGTAAESALFPVDNRLVASVVRPPSLRQIADVQDVAFELPADGGAMLLADDFANAVFSQAARGDDATRVAGTGELGFNGDNRAATTATLSHPKDIAVLPAAGAGYYVLDEANGRIRYVDGNGFIRTVVGGGDEVPVNGASPFFPLAVQAFARPEAIATDASGNIFFTEASATTTGRFGGIRFANLGPSSIFIPASGPFVPPGTICELTALPSVPPMLRVATAITATPVDPSDHLAFQASGTLSGLLWTVAPVGFGPSAALGIYVANLSSGPVTLAYDPTPSTFNLPFGQMAALRLIILNPTDIALHPSGAFLYSLDTEVVRAFNPTLGDVTVFGVVVASGDDVIVAGGGTGGDGPALQAAIDSPVGIDLDPSGNLIIQEAPGGLRLLNTGGTLSTFGFPIAGTPDFLREPFFAALDDNQDLFVADAPKQGVGEAIYRVVPEDRSLARVVGTGLPGLGNDTTAATASAVSQPLSMAFWGEKLFFADSQNSRVRVVNFGQDPLSLLGLTVRPGDVETVAGSGSIGLGAAGDSLLATDPSVEFGIPASLAIDHARSLLVIADIMDHRIRAINLGPDDLAIGAGALTIRGQSIQTIAGDGTPDTTPVPDGPALAVSIAQPMGLAIIGDLYIFGAAALVSPLAPRVCALNVGDTPQTIAGVTIPPFQVRPIAGSGAETTFGVPNGDGGPALLANFSGFIGVAVRPDGAIFVGDLAAHRIRCIAGQGPLQINGRSIAPNGIDTVLGTGVAGYGGDPTPASATDLFLPGAMLLGSAPDTLIFCDTGNRLVRAVNFGLRDAVLAGLSVPPGEVRVLAGDRSRQERTTGPQGVVVDPSDFTVFFSDPGPANRAARVFRASIEDRTVFPLAGNFGPQQSGNSIDPLRRNIVDPGALALDPDANLVVAASDSGRGRVWLVNRTAATITRYGLPDPVPPGYMGPAFDSPDLSGEFSAVAVGADRRLYVADVGGGNTDPDGGEVFIVETDGTSFEIPGGEPAGLAVDGSSLYIAYRDANVVLRCDLGATPIGGSGEVVLGDGDGAALAGTLTVTNGSSLVTGSGTSFTTELAAGDFVAFVAQPDTLYGVLSVATDTDMFLNLVYTGPTASGTATRFGDGVPLMGTVDVTNGSATVTGTGTLFLTALAAPFPPVFLAGQPDVLYRVAAVASDTSLTLEVPYAGPTLSGATLATFVGHEPGWNGERNLGTSQRLDAPMGVAFRDGILYVADYGNHRLLALNRSGAAATVAGLPLADGEVRSIAGASSPTPGFNGDVLPAPNVYLDGPVAVALDAAGNIYVADSFNRRIRRFAR